MMIYIDIFCIFKPLTALKCCFHSKYLINTNQKLSRQFVMVNYIEYYDYKYYLTEWVCNFQHSFISLSRMSFQPSKKYVSCLVRKAVLVLCYVIWLVIGPIIKKLVIGEWLKSWFWTSDLWVIGITFFSWLCNNLTSGAIHCLKAEIFSAMPHSFWWMDFSRGFGWCRHKLWFWTAPPPLSSHFWASTT